MEIYRIWLVHNRSRKYSQGKISIPSVSRGRGSVHTRIDRLINPSSLSAFNPLKCLFEITPAAFTSIATSPLSKKSTSKPDLDLQ